MLANTFILLLIAFFAGTHCETGIPLAQHCGQPLNKPNVNWRIIGGKDVQVGEFPWQIVLNPANDTNPEISNFCGGTIINRKWILTAAHCMVNMTFNVRIGVLNESLHEKTEVVSEIEKIIVHPNYELMIDPNVSHHAVLNDIALLKLKDSLNFSLKTRSYSPVCLARNNTKLTNKCVATGWGNTVQHGFQRPVNGILKKTDLHVIDNKNCEKFNNKTVFDASTQICTWYSPEGGQSVCSMDSGGPLQCLGEDGLWYQIGVTSYGYSRVCANAGEPDVFTKVTAYLDWIEKTLADN